jgi:hypothetical protein
MKYKHSKEKQKEVLKKYELGGSTGLPAGAEQQFVNYYLGEGARPSNFEQGGSLVDGYLTDPNFGNFQAGVYAEGGSLGNHGLKQGDQIIKTMSGGVQKIKTRSGDIVYVNLANGYRGAEPPLPFKNGGAVKKNLSRDRKFVNYSQDYEVRYSKDKPQRHGYTKPKMSRTQFEDESFEFFATGGSVETKVSALYSNYGFINDDMNWQFQLLEMLQNPSYEAYEIYESLTDSQKEEVLQELYEMDNDMGMDGDGDIETSKENLEILLDDSKKAKSKFADAGALGEELMGGRSNSYLKPSGYRLISSKGREIIVSDDGGKTKERWVKNNGFSGLKIVYKGNDYEFKDSFATGGGVNGKKYLTIYKDEFGSEKTEFDNYSDALADYNDFASDDANISLYEIIYGQKKLLKKNVSSANIEYVELSNGEIVVTLEKIDGKWEERDVLKGETPYGWGGKKYMSYLKPKDLAQSLGKDYGGYFEIVEQYATGGVTKNYINRSQLNTITIKKGDQKLTYKVSDVYNGAYKLEDGGNLEKTAFYVAKRNVVKVQLRDGKDVKVANGYWIKKGAKPIRASKFEDGGFMADVYATGGVIGKEITFYRHGEEEKGIIGEVNEDGSYNVSTKYSIILVEPQDVISIKDSTKKKGFFFAGGGSVSKIYVVEYEVNGNKKTSEYLLYENDKVEKMLPSNAKIISIKEKMMAGGTTTFNDKATAIAKNFEGKKVKPKYQKEFGKTYDKAEAKEVGKRVAGSQKAKYDSKMSGGGSTTKRGGAMVLAKQIRKEGESWGSALKRANEQMRKK